MCISEFVYTVRSCCDFSELPFAQSHEQTILPCFAAPILLIRFNAQGHWRAPSTVKDWTTTIAELLSYDNDSMESRTYGCYCKYARLQHDEAS